MKRGLKKTISLLLVCVLVAGMLPGAAWAEESGAGNPVDNWFSYIAQMVKEAFDWDPSVNEQSSQETAANFSSTDQLPQNSEKLQATAVEGDYEYAVVDGGATITAYKGAGGDVIIPDKIGGNPVRSIGPDAFNNRRNLKSVTIPNGVTTIGIAAFMYCDSLESVTIPSSVTNIGERAFGECKSLTNMLIPNNVVSIGNRAFLDCSSLVSVTIPNSVTSIGYQAFMNCKSLINVEIPDGMENIDDGIFSGCSSLTSITIPNSITNIGIEAFKYCTSLTSVVIPNSVKNIQEYAFRDCTSLAKVTISNGVQYMDDQVFANCTALTSVIIPKSVESLGMWAFANCSQLKTIQFDSATTIIYDYVDTMPSSTNIIGYAPSTAKDYSIKYGNPFQLIGSGTNDSDTITVPQNAMVIVLQDVTTKQPLVGATVTYNGKTITTDSSGRAVIEGANNETSLLGMTCAGYCDYQTKLKSTAGKAELYYLRKDTDTSKPYVSMINLNDGRNIIDIQRDEKAYSEIKSDGAITDSELSLVEMKANWRGKTPKKYRLTQDGKTIMESSTGVFEKKALGRLFKPGLPIYAIVEATDGTLSKALKTNIQITSNALNWSVGGAGDGELSIGKDMGFTIPGNLPVIGGTKVSSGMDLLPATVTVSPDSFKIAIGMQDAKDYLSSPDNWTKYKKSVEDAKKAANHVKEMKKWRDLFGGKSIGTKLTAGFEAETDAVGYIEGVIVDGKPVITNSSILLSVGGKYNRQMQYIIGAVPVYLEVGGAIDAELAAAIASYIPESGETKLDAEFKLTPSFELGGGAGVVGVVTVGATGKAELELLNRFTDDYQRAKLTGSMSLKATALCFEAKQEIARGTWTIYEGHGMMGTTGMDENTEQPSSNFNIYDPAQYSLMSRDYGANPTEWSGGGGINTASVDYSNQTLNVLQTNSYPNAQPRITAVGEKQMMVWLADNPGRTSANRTMLVYSIYDKNTGIWSAPTAVSDDGTADFYPQIATDGTSLYVTWQNSKSTFSESITVTDAARAGEIAVAKFETTSGTFTGMATLTNNDTLDTQPKITVSGDQVGVIWSSNDQNDLFGSTGRNSLFSAQLNGGSWSAPQTMLADQNAITSLAAGYVNGTLTAAYTPDADNDLNTITDRDLYTLGVGQSANRLTNDEILDSNPVFASFNGTNSLYWYSDGNISYVSTSNLNGTPATIFNEKKEGFSDAFTIVNNSAGKTATIWTETQDEKTEIYGSLYDDGEWNNDIKISDVDSRILYPSGIFDNDGNFNIAFNRLTLNEGAPDQSDLCTLKVVPSYNLTISEPYFEDANIIPATALPVEIDVTNSGELAVDQLMVEVKDGSSINNTQTISESIKPGETKTITAEINLPDTISRKDYTISVTPAAGDEYDLSDNQKTISIGYTDLTLILSKYDLGEEGGIVISAQLENLSYIPTDATITFKENTVDGKVLFTQTLTDVKQGENRFVTFDLDPKTMSFDSDVKQIFVSVSASGEETSTGDNSDFITLANPDTTENPDTPGGEPGFVAFLGKTSAGDYYEYSAADLNNAYLAYQINSALPSAKMYQQFLDSGCKVVALKDGAKGYMDYNGAATASLLTQMKGQAFDINAYLAGSDAKKLEDTVSIVKVVDKDGNVTN